ncbi:proliferating cell nuclear antigen, N-terminal domain-containing protein [Entophlyctis helioformis]|nr:proliferating cell nuclear antigen, N-terminal domain-containing protein [Entophlyctis helioformis]
MLEARLLQAATLKKLLDAVKELVTDANFECNDTGIALQAMDSSHISLVALLLRSSGFDHYRCDRNANLGISLTSLGKILKCAGNDDVLTLRANENADVLTLLFESKNSDRTSEFDIKLMDIDSEHLGIPETTYDAVVKMSSVEFQRICRDMGVLSESLSINCTKDGVKFYAEGDIGSGAITLKPGMSVDDEDDTATTIELNQACHLNFSLKYLNNFAKATPLAKTVTLSMSGEFPLLVEYRVNDIGYIRYYLAPKMDDTA